MRRGTIVCLILASIGFGLFAYAFASDPLWPNQDPTSKMQLEYELAKHQASLIYQWATAFIAASVVAVITQWIYIRKSSASGQPR